MTDPILEELQSAVREKQALIVCGSGISRATDPDAPDWRGLIRSGIEECAARKFTSDDWKNLWLQVLDGRDVDAWIAAADQFIEKMGGQDNGYFKTWLKRTIGHVRYRPASNTVDPVHAIASLGCRIGTTNYDDILAQATGTRPISWTDWQLFSEVLRGDKNGILHLHGHWENPESIVLGTRSYNQITANDRAQFLQRVLSFNYSMIFIGCSEDGLSDQNLGKLKAWLQGWDGHGRRHFHLVQSKDALENNPRVPIIKYGYGDKYQDLSDFLVRLTSETPASISTLVSSELKTASELDSADNKSTMPLDGTVKNASRAISILLETFRSSQTPAGPIKIDLRDMIVEADNWSKRVQFFGMSQGYSTRERTINLDFSFPRKFSNKSGESLYSEADLLGLEQNLFLLGDPGSGKTTTIKRLVQILLSPEESHINSRKMIFPLVVILREHSPDISLHEILCSRLQLVKYCWSRKDLEFSTEVDRLSSIYIGRIPLREALPRILDTFRPLIFIDGLDEVDSNQRNNIEVEISRLARRLRTTRIIVSCRSGDFTRLVEGFDVLEICPLTQQQIERIAEKWLPDPRAFFSAVEKFPSQDFLDRPLLLAQLIVIFGRAGYLPDQPATIYKRMLLLLLRDWDEERGIARRSAYADFEREQKYEFLSAIAYHLTCVIKVRQFSHDLLVQSFLAVHGRFGLPAGQARQVAREIETHTGIILEISDNTFAFSHLTLQEYLCAEYLVREPFADLRRRYLELYPGPLAVAVSLSSNPSRWFAHLVVEVAGRPGFALWASFLSRIIVERPRFVRSDILGLAILRICMIIKADSHEVLNSFIELPHARESLQDILRYYESPNPEEKGLAELKMTAKSPIVVDELRLPVSGTVSSAIFHACKRK